MSAQPAYRISGIVVFFALVSSSAPAEEYLNQSRSITGPPASSTESFDFTLGKDSPYPYLELTIQMSQGRADLRILGPSGSTLETVGAQKCEMGLQPIRGATTPGKYTLELTTTGAVGQ